MKNIIIILIINAIFTPLGTLKGNTQGTLSVSTNDKVFLFTDRNLYVVGEPILFSSFIENESGIRSSVLYVEIISHDGISLLSEKFRINEKKTNGSLIVSKEFPTGKYFIKAYTKWMRNFGPDFYSYTPVKLINPSREIAESRANVPNGLGVKFRDIEIKNNCLSSDKESYKPRETATLSFLEENDESDLTWACLSIVPCATISNSYSTIITNTKDDYQLVYPPEEQGISISGKVVTPTTDELLPHALVNISILGPYPDFIPVRTNYSGQFNLNLPNINGNYDLYIGLDLDSHGKIIVDNDFCTRSIDFNHSGLGLSQKEHNAAQNILNNIEISKQFPLPFLSEQIQNPFINQEPFYGTPDMVFEFSKYIDLLSLKEYFYELLPIYVKEKKGSVSFGFYENFPEFKIFDPLLMVDNIVLTDASRVLAADPKLLSRIEIISKPYYKGNMVYGGVVSFFSKKGDFAGIELPSSDIFLNYKFFQDKPRVYPPMQVNKCLPDTRTTILWNPDFHPEVEGPTVVSFQTPDTKGEYDILLRGVTSRGNVVFKRHTIQVK
ncbi:MAG: hypothetical protein RBR98_02475 [Candidatus Moranbacteria bacterium]|jgi:hypothetical protein|nr:hypothetical protein [Candidatus Moranbacteria bacterium]